MRCRAAHILYALLCSAGFHAGVDVGLDLGQAAHGIALELIQQAEAAGTRRRMTVTNVSGARETSNGTGNDGRGKRCAGARASQAEIGFVRRQQRHKSNPKYGPEDHESACSCWYANRMRQGVFRALKSFAKFETNWRFMARSSH
jgi:hypothetical protein